MSKRPTDTIIGYKAFNDDLTCHGLQYELGKTKTHTGPVQLCQSGLHFCEDPLDVLAYYPPAGSRFAEVEAEEVASKKDGDDSKRVARKLKIRAELSLSALLGAGIKFRMDKVDWSKAEGTSKEDSGAASATGKESVAVALGIEGKAMAARGGWITLAEWKRDADWNWHRIDVQTRQVDGEDVKADTFYQLVGGKLVEAAL